MAKLSLTDLISVEELQNLQDAFATANGVASTITDHNGVPITKPSNYCRVCALIRKTTKGYENCRASGEALGINSLNQEKPYSHHCKSIGFVDASAPIMIEDQHIANWLIGQTCAGDVTEERILQYADEIGADPRELLSAFRKMSFISEKMFNKKLDFLWMMAGQLSTLAYHNHRYKETVKVLKKRERELNSYRSDLEKLVNQRTAELETALEEVRKASMKDSLTGCYNRAYINESLPRELRRAQRYNNPFSIILCDIDHFKMINDTYGHQAGDSILQQIADCLRERVRKDVDWVARYGGEEFLIALPVSSGREANKAGGRLRESIAALDIVIDGNPIPVRASFGVTSVENWKLYAGMSQEELIRNADNFLYIAKSQGRDCVVSGVPERIS